MAQWNPTVDLVKLSKEGDSLCPISVAEVNINKIYYLQLNIDNHKILGNFKKLIARNFKLTFYVLAATQSVDTMTLAIEKRPIGLVPMLTEAFYTRLELSNVKHSIYGIICFHVVTLQVEFTDTL
jgi:hypothetical protein